MVPEEREEGCSVVDEGESVSMVDTKGSDELEDVEMRLPSRLVVRCEECAVEGDNVVPVSELVVVDIGAVVAVTDVVIVAAGTVVVEVL